MNAITEKPKLTKSQEAAADVTALLRARHPLIWIVTQEEARVELHLFQAIAQAGYKPRTWDVGQGVVMSIGGKPVDAESADPGNMLDRINAAALKNPGGERGVWILRDFPVWITGPGAARTLRQVRNLARMLPGIQRESAQAMIILSPSGDVPPELAGGHATVIEWPIPDRAEIAAMLVTAIEANRLPPNQITSATREAAIDAAIGLSGEEVESCFARSLVSKRIDPKAIAQEKKRVVAREGVLEWYDPIPDGMNAVGGLDNLKGWLEKRSKAFSAKAREYGLPSPKGMMLIGISGCGKSLTAKAVSTTWTVPLLRIDLGALKSKYVGDSERNLRKAFDVIKAIGRCVVWFDEIEKALAGATQGAADGGVSADALGTILTWMQERQGEAFVIMTANDVSGLPPELLRKGRFDEIWFVDLPNAIERVEVLKAALRFHGRDKAKIDLVKVANACDGFTGSEIAALVPDALFAAFDDKAREISTNDLLAAAYALVPLSRTAAEKIKTLRDWAEGRARKATSPLAVTRHQSGGRVIDVEVEET